MPTQPTERHPSDSEPQRIAEREILAVLEKQIDAELRDTAPVEQQMKPDGYHDADVPICVEVFAHQGKCKPGQRHKVMSDMCKLLLLEKLIGRRCRKIVAVCDPAAIRFLANSWRGQFATEFEIDVIPVSVSEETRERVREAQKRQVR